MLATFKHIQSLVNKSDGLLITAGAGMSVDSGIPDFRGSEGLWKNFISLATPSSFRNVPERAWDFYNSRLNVLQYVEPHIGYGLLLDIAERFNNNYFVVTSNVDGLFIKAGFNANKIWEVHGNLSKVQCLEACTNNTWSVGSATGIKQCRYCDSIARPNVLMFNDLDWVNDEFDQQNDRYLAWVKKVSHPLVIEIGAGKVINTIRTYSEDFKKSLIRINPVDFDIPHNLGVSIPLTAKIGIQVVKTAIDGTTF